MIQLVVTAPAAEVELASDALWSLGVVAVEERTGADGAVELWTSLGENREVVAAAVVGVPASWRWRTVEVDAFCS